MRILEVRSGEGGVEIVVDRQDGKLPEIIVLDFAALIGDMATGRTKPTQAQYLFMVKRLLRAYGALRDDIRRPLVSV